MFLAKNQNINFLQIKNTKIISVRLYGQNHVKKFNSYDLQNYRFPWHSVLS